METENAYLIVWVDEDGEQDGVVVSALTIAEADEKFGRCYENKVMEIRLLGDYCRCEMEEAGGIADNL